MFVKQENSELELIWKYGGDLCFNREKHLFAKLLLPRK